MTKEELELEIAELRNWWKKPSYVAALFPTVLVLAALVYGFANGYFHSSSVKLENQKYDLQKQTEGLRSEIAVISREKAALEQKKLKIAEQLEKTKTLIESSKNPSAEVKAHIEVLSTCVSCPTPAWIQSQKKIFTALEEMEKILHEDPPAK